MVYAWKNVRLVFRCDAMTVRYCMEKVSNPIQLMLYGRLTCITEKGDPSKGTYCFATTNVTFWAKREAWEIPRKLCTIYTTDHRFSHFCR
jgi:hypothetical protein